MDFTELIASKTTVNSIRGWCNWDVAPAEAILTEAQAFVYSKLRVAQMEELDIGTIASGTISLEMPDEPRFIKAKSFRRTGEAAGRIRVYNRAAFEDKLTLDTDTTYFEDTPNCCAIYGDPPTAHFDKRANSDYPYRLLYYGKPALLSVSNPTNWLTEDFPFLLRAACLFQAFRFKKEFNAAKEHQVDLIGLIASANGGGDDAEQIDEVENDWRD